MQAGAGEVARPRGNPKGPATHSPPRSRCAAAASAAAAPPAHTPAGSGREVRGATAQAGIPAGRRAALPSRGCGGPSARAHPPARHQQPAAGRRLRAHRGQQAAAAVWVEEERVAAVQGVDDAAVGQLGLHQARLARQQRGQRLVVDGGEGLARAGRGGRHGGQRAQGGERGGREGLRGCGSAGEVCAAGAAGARRSAAGRTSGRAARCAGWCGRRRRAGRCTLSTERRSSLPSLPLSWCVLDTLMFFLNIVRPQQPPAEAQQVVGAAAGVRVPQAGSAQAVGGRRRVAAAAAAPRDRQATIYACTLIGCVPGVLAMQSPGLLKSSASVGHSALSLQPGYALSVLPENSCTVFYGRRNTGPARWRALRARGALAAAAAAAAPLAVHSADRSIAAAHACSDRR